MNSLDNLSHRIADGMAWLSEAPLSLVHPWVRCCYWLERRCGLPSIVKHIPAYLVTWATLPLAWLARGCYHMADASADHSWSWCRCLQAAKEVAEDRTLVCHFLALEALKLELCRPLETAEELADSRQEWSEVIRQAVKQPFTSFVPNFLAFTKVERSHLKVLVDQHKGTAVASDLAALLTEWRQQISWMHERLRPSGAVQMGPELLDRLKEFSQAAPGTAIKLSRTKYCFDLACSRVVVKGEVGAADTVYSYQHSKAWIGQGGNKKVKSLSAGVRAVEKKEYDVDNPVDNVCIGIWQGYAREMAAAEHVLSVALHVVHDSTRLGLRQRVMHFMPLCSEGSLQYSRQLLTPSEVSSIERQVIAQRKFKAALEFISGLVELHDKGFVHRDIKLDNALLDANGRVWISDWLDTTLCVQDDISYHVPLIVGTIRMMAPELYCQAYLYQDDGSYVMDSQGRPQLQRIWGHLTGQELKQIDIYAAGVSLYALLTERRDIASFQGPVTIQAAIADMSNWNAVGLPLPVCQQLQSLVTQMTATDPQQRGCLRAHLTALQEYGFLIA